MIRKTKLEELRSTYPPGTRIVLDHMSDPQAPVPGMQGTVVAVDDNGQLLVNWDNGSSLSVILHTDDGVPLDRIHKIRTEEEAVTTLNHLGQHQEDQNAICPRCGDLMPGATTRHALSRYAQIYVCDTCGNLEAVEVAGLIPKKPLMDWDVLQED